MERMGLEALDEEAEIRCRERGGRVGEVLGGEKISDIDCVEERFHPANQTVAGSSGLQHEGDENG